MKRLLFIIVMILALIPSIKADAANITMPKKMTLNVSDGYKQKRKLKIKTAESIELKAVKYSTSNRKIAKVSKKGLVTAVKQGKSVIKANIKYKKNKKIYSKKIKCKVTVKRTDPVLSETEHNMEKGETFKLELLYAKNKHIEWNNSDISVAKFSSVGDGYVYLIAVGPGTTTITCTCDGREYICLIKVNGEDTDSADEENIDWDESE